MRVGFFGKVRKKIAGAPAKGTEQRTAEERGLATNKNWARKKTSKMQREGGTQEIWENGTEEFPSGYSIKSEYRGRGSIGLHGPWRSEVEKNHHNGSRGTGRHRLLE